MIRNQPRRSSLPLRRVHWLAILLVSFAAAPAHAQNPDELLPAESAAKAKTILQQAIAGLGGQAYLDVRDSDCSGRLGQFDSAGQSGGSIDVRIVKQAPDKTRTEFHGNNYITTLFFYEVHGKGTTVNVYSREQGWTLDKDGVTEVPADALAQYQDQYKTDLNTILRQRMNDDTLSLRYGGTEVVDLKQADWVEIADREGHNFRIAVDRSTHLPIESEVTKRDPQTGRKIQDTTLYSGFHLVDGIQTPFRVSHLRNGLQATELAYDRCRYNTGVSEDLFTREGLAAQSRKSK